MEDDGQFFTIFFDKMKPDSVRLKDPAEACPKETAKLPREDGVEIVKLVEAGQIFSAGEAFQKAIRKISGETFVVLYKCRYAPGFLH